MQRKSSFSKYVRSFVNRHVPPKPKYSCSSTSSGSLSSLNSHPSSSSLAYMADLSIPALRRTLESLDDPFKLWKARRISKEAESFVLEKFSKIKKMNVRKENLSELETEGKPEVDFLESSWYIHPEGCKVLTRFGDADFVEIVVDDHWNSKDVIVLDEVIGMFRNSVEEIFLDAPIVELVSFLTLKNQVIFIISDNCITFDD